jgi:ribonuclease VapC
MTEDRPSHVLDASAVLALLNEEPGADEAEGLLEDSAMSTVNLSEVLQKAAQHGADIEGLEYDLEALGVRLVDFGARLAREAAELWTDTSPAGLSLGDRACLALAASFGAVAATADRRWVGIPGLSVDISLVR